MSNQSLNISDDISLPIEFVTQTQAILARKRVGKSYTASVQTEEMLRLGQQVLVIDYTGAWWGLRAGRNGKPEGGYPIHVFGGDHADVPLEERSGEVIAGAAVKERFSAILDLANFRKNEALRFLAPFLETLYRLNREPLHLFADEADAYAPQRTFGGEDARTLGAMNDIVLRGGIRGVGCSIITQRSSRINKDVLSQCGILTALRTSSPRDLAAVREWVEVHDEGKQADEMMKSLPTLPIGTAWMWAPGWPNEAGIFKRIRIRLRETFDSGATPKPGQTVKAPKTLRPVDLVKLGETIRQTAEQAKANDPAELKRQLAATRDELAKTLAAKAAAPGKAAPAKIKLKPVITDKQLLAIDRLGTKLDAILPKAGAVLAELAKRQTAAQAIGDQLSASVKAVEEVLRDAKQINAGESSPAPAASGTRPLRNWPGRPYDNGQTFSVPSQAITGAARVAPAASVTSSQWFRPAHQRLLNALAWLSSMGRTAWDRSVVAAMAGVSPKSSSFLNDVSRLSSAGYVTYPQPGYLSLTQAGATMAAVPNSPPTLIDLHAAWRGCPILRPAHIRLVDALIAQHPEVLTREELAEAADVSPNSSSFLNDVSRLSALGLAKYPHPGCVAAGPMLFPEGLS